MNKIAFFVEGLTERLLVERLLTEIAGEDNIELKVLTATGGSKFQRQFSTVSVKKANNCVCSALIVQCSTDNRVASDMRDQYAKLSSSGYSVIIGIRDIFPDFKSTDIPRFRKALSKNIDAKEARVVYVLGVMEVEAWFLAEHNHFEKIHPGLTPPIVKATLGFDPETYDIQNVAHPAEQLHNVYQTVGFSYKKINKSISRTVRVLDIANIYLSLGDRFDDIKTLLNEINVAICPR